MEHNYHNSASAECGIKAYLSGTINFIHWTIYLYPHLNLSQLASNISLDIRREPTMYTIMDVCFNNNVMNKNFILFHNFVYSLKFKERKVIVLDIFRNYIMGSLKSYGRGFAQEY